MTEDLKKLLNIHPLDHADLINDRSILKELYPGIDLFIHTMSINNTKTYDIIISYKGKRLIICTNEITNVKIVNAIKRLENDPSIPYLSHVI